VALAVIATAFVEDMVNAGDVRDVGVVMKRDVMLFDVSIDDMVLLLFIGDLVFAEEVLTEPKGALLVRLPPKPPMAEVVDIIDVSTPLAEDCELNVLVTIVAGVTVAAPPADELTLEVKLALVPVSEADEIEQDVATPLLSS